MATGRGNKLVGQVGEFLVCAELGRRGLIATPFSGNVPGFDVVAVDSSHRPLVIQVKTAGPGDWQFDALKYLTIDYNITSGTQQVTGKTLLPDPHTIYVFVKLRRDEAARDRFFILTREEVQNVAFEHYSTYLDRQRGQRPKQPGSFHMALRVADLAKFENNWPLITDRPPG